MTRQRERVTFKRGPVARGTVGTGLSRNPKSVVRRCLSGVETLLDLQYTHGNAIVQRLIQRQLSVSEPDDRCGQEADRVAKAVMHQEQQGSAGSAQTQSINRQMPEEDKEKLQGKFRDDKISRQVEEEEEMPL